MKISKFFRKYSRILLLVFMSLLLVVFLVGDVIGRSAQRMRAPNPDIGDVYERTITERDLNATLADVEVLGMLNIPPPQIITDDPFQHRVGLHLLFAEARQMGVRVSLEEAKVYLQRIGVRDVQINAVRDRTGRSLDSIYGVVADRLAVSRLAELQLDAVSQSLPRVELSYRDLTQEARVELSVVNSRAFLPRVTQPTEEELRAHFEQAKSRFAAHSEEKLEFGYRLPDRIRLEYVTVDPREIQVAVRVREKEALRYYQDHAELYVQRVPRTVPGTTQPGTVEYDEVQQTYEQVADRVREDCRAAKAVKEAQRLVNVIQQEARRPWSEVPRDDAGFLVKPPDDKLAPLSELSAEHSEQYSVVCRRTDLLDQAGLAAEPVVGRSEYMAGTRGVRISEFAFRVKGLFEPDEDDPLPVLNIFEPSPVLMDFLYDPVTRTQQPYQAYFFRVVEVVPSGPPDSLDAVREQVSADTRLRAAHQMAGEHARQLAEAALKLGLEAAVAEDNELKNIMQEADAAEAGAPAAAQPAAGRFARELGPFVPAGRFTRQPTFIRNVGRCVSLHEEVFALAETSADARQTNPRVVVVQAADQFKWIVAELKEIRPIYADDFQQQRDMFARRAGREAYYAFAQAWFDAENILSRTGFVAAAVAEQ